MMIEDAAQAAADREIALMTVRLEGWLRRIRGVRTQEPRQAGEAWEVLAGLETELGAALQSLMRKDLPRIVPAKAPRGLVRRRRR